MPKGLSGLLLNKIKVDRTSGMALWVIFGFVILGIWVNLVGYTSAFQAAAQTDVNYPIVRIIYHVGRILAVLCFLIIPRFFINHRNALIVAIPLAMCLGTASFGFAYHQTLIDAFLLAIIGSFLMGFGYSWTIASLSVHLAESYGMKAVIIIVTASQILEQLLSIGANYLIPDTYLILVCPLLPLALLICFAIVLKKTKPSPREGFLSGAAKTHQIALLIIAAVSVVVLGALSNVGIWGTQRADYITADSDASTIETLFACLIIVVLSKTTLYSSTKEPLSLRYQIPFLVILGGLLLIVARQSLRENPGDLYSSMVMAVEYYSHILVVIIAVSSMKNLDTPLYRAGGIGMSVYSILSLAWILLLENGPHAAGAVVTSFCFLLVIVIAAHPRLLYNRTTHTMTSIDELNEYTLEGEPEIPLESNGKTVAETLLRRCEYLSREYKLSNREQQVLYLLAEGRTRPIIQKTLVLSEGTTKTHISHIYAKMRVQSHQELLDLVFSTSQTSAGSE